MIVLASVWLSIDANQLAGKKVLGADNMSHQRRSAICCLSNVIVEQCFIGNAICRVVIC